MAERIKKGDFVEIDYDGFTKEEDALFDTTDEKKAISAGMHNSNASYGGAIIRIGNHQLLGGIDESLIDAGIGEEKTVNLPCEKAFGKKDAKLLKIVPMKVFQKENIRPMPGLQVQIDGLFGIIKTASGGRVIVDFNHPLANKDVYYRLKPKRIITDINEKIVSIAGFEMNIPKQFISIKQEADAKAEGKNFTIKLPFKLPAEIATRLEEILKKDIAGIGKIAFVEERPVAAQNAQHLDHKHNHGQVHGQGQSQGSKDSGKDAHGRSPGDEHFGHHHA